MLVYLPLCLLAFLLSCQIQLREVMLLTGRYNYKIGKTQLAGYAATLLAIAIVVADILCDGSDGYWLAAQIATFLLAFFSEWLLSRLNPASPVFTYCYRLLIIILISITLHSIGIPCLTPFVVYGLYVRNNFFGTVHGRYLFFSPHLIQRGSISFDSGKDEEQTDRRYCVADFDILPNQTSDMTGRLQRLIDNIGGNGGGIIYFPKGTYLFNTDKKDRQYLQINHSNITLEGETDTDGRPLAKLVCTNALPNKPRNPWLCPFFITTGEALQQSNMFWGLQFKHRQNIITRSNSLSDPGSDGTILTPEYATEVTADAKAGDTIIEVTDTSVVGKYIVIGMYNTTPDGNLIKDILGVDTLRPEWRTAHRAGAEAAPSFQWLAEVKQIIDSHRIELSHPLFRDVEMKYKPVVFNAKMLENIHIRNLHIISRWNGLFHHHGFPFYYTVRQSREMDYEWNAINMKRVAHGSISNVILDNFTNPLYLLDSTDINVSHILFKGSDGHQGIKLYEHTCFCHLSDIVFTNHFADMMGGEGNAYKNVFSHISYRNPNFHPVDFDFHGFSEGPMSPPSHNLFEGIKGFRYIKAAGAIYNQPAMGQKNQWKDIQCEGERRGENLFYAMSYQPHGYVRRHLSAFVATLKDLIRRKRLDSQTITAYKQHLQSISSQSIPRTEHHLLFKGCILSDIHTTSHVPPAYIKSLSSAD